jgi:hypothetical protein
MAESDGIAEDAGVFLLSCNRMAKRSDSSKAWLTQATFLADYWIIWRAMRPRSIDLIL